MAVEQTQLPAVPANLTCAACPFPQMVFELSEKVAELEARLARYENAHTPPSLKEKNKVKPKSSSLGRPKGYKGSTRPMAEPERIIGVTRAECPHCHSPLEEPIKIETRTIEEIPEPRPITVTEFRVAHYDCPSCEKHVIARHPECPTEGRFGPRALAHITLLKYDDRLPHRKVWQDPQEGVRPGNHPCHRARCYKEGEQCPQRRVRGHQETHPGI